MPPKSLYLHNLSNATNHSAFSTGNHTVKELSLAKATVMTSPPAIPPEEGTTTMATTGPGLDDNPNIDKLTAVGSIEDGLQNAKTKPELEAPLENKDATAAVAQMFNLATIGESQLAENEVAPASDSLYAQNLDPFPMTSGQELQNLVALAPIFDSDLALNQLGQNPYAGMPIVMGQQPFLDPSPYIPEPQETQVSAYAKLEFEDGEFYMNTFSVILGRDQVAAKRARKRELKQQLRREKGLQEFGQDPRTPVQIKREESRYSKSIVSESGGIMRDGDDPDPEKRRQRRMGKARKSSKLSRSDSSSHSSSRRNSYFPSNTRVVYKPQPHPPSNRYVAPMTDDAIPVDPDSLRPDPSGCPLIGIHPNVTKGSGSYKNISREHVKISFNSDKHVFEAHMIGRNGAFFDRDSCDSHNMQHHPVGTKVTLTSGCYLQIADVRVKFVLPDVRHGETGAERPDYAEEEVTRCYSEGGKEMSFDFEDDPRHVPADSDDQDESEVGSGEDDDRNQGEEFSEDDGNREREEGDDGGDEEEDDDDGQDGDQLTPNHAFEDEEKPRPSKNPEPSQQSPKVEKKRGPGRPPKDGIMSKREKQLAKRLEQEALAQAQSGGKGAKTTASKTTASKTTASKTTAGKTTASKAPAPPAASSVGPDGQAPPVKNKVGRPRKHPLPEVPAEPRQKRKYTKRKPKEPKEGEVQQEGSGGDNPATPVKKEKPPKEPQSPPLVLNEADYTEEQLQKPGANYVLLIFEALSNHPDGQMTLPQIYKAIERRYPWFHFKAQTNGWQSSVRHNLGQNTSFMKVTREGKGWKWALAPGATIDKEKKRMPPPPPPAPPGQIHPIYPNAYQMIPGQTYGYPPGMGPQGYHPYGPPPNLPPGQYPYMGPPPPHMNGQPHHPGPYSMGPPVGVPAIMPPQLAAPNAPSAYSSPYALKPASANENQPGEQTRQTEQRPNIEERNGNPVPPPYEHATQPPRPQGQQPQTAPLLQPQATKSVSQQTPPQPPREPPSDGSKMQPSPPVANTATLNAVKKFKDIVMGTATSRSNIEDIIDSASSQVLGRHTRSALPEADQKYELQIKEALINMLRKIPETNISELLSTKALGNQNNQGGPAPQVPATDANQNRTQASAPPPPQQPAITTGSEMLAPSIVRPQFNGHSHSHPPQNRANISISRPPMMGPNNATKRTNSGSPAPWGNTGSGSPAHPVSNGASAPVLAANENVGSLPAAGQKRTHDEATPSDADDMREFKRLSTSGPPQVKT